MTSLGVNIAIFEAGKILLTQREDFEIWCLPGGGVDAGESLAAAALREAREETGLEVELTRLVGSYSRPQWTTESAHVLVFAARPVGGSLVLQPGEVIAARYFGPDEIPADLLADQELRIRHAFSGVGGSAVWTQDTPWTLPPGLSRAEFYKLRDASGLPRPNFYFQYFGNLDPRRNRAEVRGQEPQLDGIHDGESI